MHRKNRIERERYKQRDVNKASIRTALDDQTLTTIVRQSSVYSYCAPYALYAVRSAITAIAELLIFLLLPFNGE